MDEKSVSAEFVSIFSERFDLIPNGWLRHPVAGQNLCIDFIGFDKLEEAQGPIGFEIKDPELWNSSTGKYNAFSKALSQCIDYQNHLINCTFKNPAYRKWHNQRLAFTFLFPVDARWGYNERGFKPIDQTVSMFDRDSAWAAGALRLAGCFGVGAACNDKTHGWLLTISTHPVFRLKSGPTDLFFKHAVAVRSGSSR